MFKLKMLMFGIMGQMEPEKGAGGTGGKGKKPTPKPDPKPKAEDPAPDDGDDNEEVEDGDDEEVEDDDDEEVEDDDDAQAAREQIEKLKKRNADLKEKLKNKGGDVDPPAPKSGPENETARALAKLKAENDRLKREASDRKAREQIASRLATEGLNGALLPLLSAGLMALAVDDEGELDSFEVSGHIKGLKKSLPQLFGAAAKPKGKTTASPDTGQGKGSDDKPKPKKGEPTAKELAEASRAQAKGKAKRWI